MSENSEEDKKEVGEHVDSMLTFFRRRAQILSHYGLEMEDFLFMEAMVEDTSSVPLHRIYGLAMINHEEFDIMDMDQARQFIRGAIIGYALGLKSTWPDSRDDDESDELVPA